MNIHIQTTRFNQDTWNENVAFRTKYNYGGCIYNSPRLMSPKVKPDSIVYMLEMNNTLNRIEGIGSIINCPVLHKHYKIHGDANYNRFAFQSRIRLDRQEIQDENSELLELLETLCFKGKTHVKRGHGFMSISAKAIQLNDAHDITERVHRLFMREDNVVAVAEMQEKKLLKEKEKKLLKEKEKKLLKEKKEKEMQEKKLLKEKKEKEMQEKKLLKEKEKKLLKEKKQKEMQEKKLLKEKEKKLLKEKKEEEKRNKIKRNLNR